MSRLSWHTWCMSTQTEQNKFTKAWVTGKLCHLIVDLVSPAWFLPLKGLTFLQARITHDSALIINALSLLKFHTDATRFRVKFSFEKLQRFLLRIFPVQNDLATQIAWPWLHSRYFYFSFRFTEDSSNPRVKLTQPCVKPICTLH